MQLHKHYVQWLGVFIAASGLLGTACGGGGGTTGSGGSSTTSTTTGSGGSGGTGGSAPVCGDGRADAGEECDEGDKNSDTGACTKACKNASCGDGLVQDGVEACDQGDKNSDTGACTKACKSASCGDSLVQDGVEDCDQGDQNSDTGACTKACKNASCGDSLVQTGVEECDQGAQNSDTGACTKACKSAKCGDSLVQSGVEDCDLGQDNSDTGDCTSMCKTASCGDGFVHAGAEECDQGAMNSDTGACTKACKNAVCGDGLVGPNEQCDLGAMNNDMGACTTQCKSASCGDGFLQAGEQCDQGMNNSDTGACTTMCKTAACGDGFVQAGVEQCDLGAMNSNNGACTLACKNAVCGDGFKGPNEPCDDGNMVNGDGCNNNCVVSGTPIWTQTYNGAANGAEFWSAVVTDAQGNVYVTGGEPVTGQNYNILIRKYDANGGIVWTQSYNGAANGEDVGQGIALDPMGNVIVIGYETVAAQGKNIWLRKYTSAGVLVWTQSYDGLLHLDDFGYGVVTNAAGDLFIAASIQSVGNQGQDILVAKVAGLNGSLGWFDTFNGGASQADEAIGITLDSAGAIVATGYTRAAASFDTWTRKYTDNGVSNTIQWTRTYAGVAGGTDFGYAVAADSMGNTVVAGAETVANQNFNIWIRKYDTMGNTVWTQTYDGAAHQSDQGLGVAIDASGNVIVSGVETLANMTSDVWVRKYTSSGATLWTQTYNGAGDGNDVGNFVAVDPAGNLLVCGSETTAAAQGVNAWLRKYAP